MARISGEIPGTSWKAAGPSEKAEINEGTDEAGRPAPTTAGGT